MTWGEIQIESLKKMFLNTTNLDVFELDEYKEQKKYKTYLNAMPQACNEAIIFITNLQPIIKSFKLNVVEERYNLKELIEDFKCIENVITNKPWGMETESVLNIEKNAGEIIIYYESYPTLIDEYYDDNEKIDMDEDCVRNIPLYIAGQLYKDDDLTLSTVYMNEFINNINLITGRTKTVVNNKITPIYTMN